MSIKFNCPHCGGALAVKDELAGKRGNCPKCKGVVTMPRTTASPAAGAPAGAPAAPAPAPARPAPAPAARQRLAAPPESAPAAVPKAAPAPPPAPHPGDVEAEAAALFADKPAEEVPAEVKTIDFTCDYCGEALHLPIDLAGKRAPCPECKRILKVPVPQQKKKDWRNIDTRAPAGAKLPDEPAPEGAWGSTNTRTVSGQALEEAGALPQEPRTWREKLRPYLLAGVGLAVLVAGVMVARNWLTRVTEEQALRQGLDYFDPPLIKCTCPHCNKHQKVDGKLAGKKATCSKCRKTFPVPDPAQEALKQVGRGGVAALHSAAAEYYLRSRSGGSATKARDQYGKALAALRGARGGENDALRAELALAQVDLGGGKAEVAAGVHLPWDEVQKAVRATLTAITAQGARGQALRAVCRRLAERGQAQRLLPLATQLASSPGPDRYEALSIAGLELLRAGKKADAEKAAEQALPPYADAKAKDRPALRSAVVALALALGKPAPEAGSASEDRENAAIGQAEGLALQGKREEAREAAHKAPSKEARLRALLAVASTTGDGKAGDGAEVEAALKAAEGVTDRRRLSWPLLHLLEVGGRSGQPEERLQAAAALIPDRGVRAWGQLVALRARLDSSRQAVGAGALDQVEANSVAGLVAREALARHNVRYDSGWSKVVQGWEEGPRAFGSLGVALGLQAEKK
jgi:hypothetical protein